MCSLGLGLGLNGLNGLNSWGLNSWGADAAWSGNWAAAPQKKPLLSLIILRTSRPIKYLNANIQQNNNIYICTQTKIIILASLIPFYL
jgi:hypothetical protein